jgi:hypothetical protein
MVLQVKVGLEVYRLQMKLYSLITVTVAVTVVVTVLGRVRVPYELSGQVHLVLLGLTHQPIPVIYKYFIRRNDERIFYTN